MEQKTRQNSILTSAVALCISFAAPFGIISDDSASFKFAPSKYIIDQVENLPESKTNQKHVFPVPSESLPDQGDSFIQPETGHRITRISDLKHSFFSSLEGHPAAGLTNGYSRFTCSNIDDEYVLAFSTEQSILLYELPECRFLKELTYDGIHFIGESNDPKWDMSGSPGTETTIYYHVDTGIFKQDVLQGCSSHELVYNFSREIIPEDHMDQDKYARYRAVRFPDKIAVLDLRKKRVLPGKIKVSYGGCDISTEGDWLYVQGFGEYEMETRFYKIVDLEQGLTNNYVVLPCPNHGHDGWAYDYNGNEVYTFQDNTNDWFSTFNPVTSERMDILHMSETGWEFGQHMGRIHNLDKIGWLLMSSYTWTDNRWADNQIFLLEILPHNKNPRIWRIASTHNSWNGDYFAEAFASISADGNSIYWGANWMGKDNLELYRVELPSNWHKVLSPDACIIYPVQNLSGQKVLNRALFQAEYINVIRWEPHPNNKNISSCRVYDITGNSPSLLAEIPKGAYEFHHRNVDRNQSYSYMAAAVDEKGNEGVPAFITVN
jgi:hypothetical protein